MTGSKINTYIISLKGADDRRENIRRICNPYRDTLELIFVDAVDGRNKTEEQLGLIFNQEKAYSTYGRYLKGGEVGCTLSHKKCIDLILRNNDDVAIIIEDDMGWQNGEIVSKLLELRRFMTSEKPMMTLLSGDYWFVNKKKLSDTTCVASVREACTSHAYMINRNAAKAISRIDNYLLADDYYLLKKSGFKLYGLYPHIADQNREKFETVITGGYVGTIRKNLKLGKRIHSYCRAIVKHILYYTSHFEFKSELANQ